MGQKMGPRLSVPAAAASGVLLSSQGALRFQAGLFQQRLDAKINFIETRWNGRERDNERRRPPVAGTTRPETEARLEMIGVLQKPLLPGLIIAVPFFGPFTG